MLAGDKNLKDSDIKDTSALSTSYQTSGFDSVSYTKAQKLITALYMVTDIIEKDEPIRNKLRTLGVEILSDITSVTRFNPIKNIQGVLSFLDVAFTMNMISEMNKNILINEFTQLKNSLILPQDNPVWLGEFLKEEKLTHTDEDEKREILFHNNSIGHFKHTRIGVQKGSTLLKALSSVKDIHKNDPAPYEAVGFRSGFDLLKKERRLKIINIIKNNGGNSTITDIKIKINTGAQGSLTFSEKTLQRELMSMTKDGVLYKEGSKRWSRYFIK